MNRNYKKGWNHPLFYLDYFPRVTIKLLLKSIRLWVFYKNKDEIHSFIRVLGFYSTRIKDVNYLNQYEGFY